MIIDNLSMWTQYSILMNYLNTLVSDSRLLDVENLNNNVAHHNYLNNLQALFQ